MTRASIGELAADTIRVEGGGGVSEFRHSTSEVQVFDLYLPDAICRLAATDRFIARLGMFSEGATLYQGVEGDWYNQSEPVRVLRLSITTVKSDGDRVWEVDDVRAAVRKLVAEYMADLVENHGHTEEAIFFNDWVARGTVVVPLKA